MDTLRSDDPGLVRSDGLSRRKALLHAGAGGFAAALLGAVGLRRSVSAQEAAPAGWRTEHLEFDVTPTGVTITRAGGGPPQRGDFNYADGPIFAAGDVNGTEIGRYQCFGAWTNAADDATATDQRFTTVQYRFADGAVMGLINEAGTEAHNHIGAVQGGTGKYASALGNFQQAGSTVGVATPEAPPPAAGTPAAGQLVLRITLDLLLPASS